jgi:hypothetical protein
MRRIAVTTATIAITAGVLFTAAPAQADEPHKTSETSETSDTKVLHHCFQLHYLDRDPHMTPRGMTHSVRHAHRPGT